MTKINYYDVLGVARNVDASELKRAYHELAMRFHPDKNPGDLAAEENFKQVSEAYTVLSDPEKRLRYDRLGSISKVAEFDFSLASFTQLFENLFGDLWGQRGGQRGKPARIRGRDLHYTLELDFVEAALGCEKTITFPARVACEACNATGARGGTAGLTLCTACGGRGEVKVQQGFFSVGRTCAACHGNGKVAIKPCAACHGLGLAEKQREFTVKIPPATDDGAIRRVVGQGEAGRGGGAAGDLNVSVKVKPHPLLKREGKLVLCDLPVSVSEAALGAVLNVPTLDGTVEMRIPAGSQSETVFRLRHKGIPGGGNGAARGDAHVRLVVETPCELGRNCRELLKQLDAALPAKSMPRRTHYQTALQEHEARLRPAAKDAKPHDKSL